MKEKYILYIILHKKKNLLKIGKTKESFKSHRYKKIDDDFKGVLFDKSYYVESIKQEEIDNLERILHKIFYEERRKDYYKEGVGKTEWFKAHILNDVFKQIKQLKKTKNFQHLSNIQQNINMESNYLKRRFKLRAYIFFFSFFIGVLLGFYLKLNITDIELFFNNLF